MNYRREIDGLRAIAIVPVVLFHAGFTSFSGGYVGVDVFFVISGYLLTTIIYGEIVQNRFSILKFYERRIRRIMPALVLVILVCLPPAMFWMLPWQLMEFGRSVMAVSLFSSNFFFWSESGYFAPVAESKPLLHTWSLAVEEQFYVFLPLFLILVWRYGKKALLALILIGAFASLLLAEWGWRFSPNAAFYLLPTRAWELLAGSAVAVVLLDFEPKPGTRTELASLVGLALILYSIFVFDDYTPFPSLWTGLPVLGTAIIILFCRSQSLIGRLLGTPLCVGIGLISYSAYLWHQPLFAFARLAHWSEIGFGPIVMIALGLLSFFLAWASWKFVEGPFRDKTFSAKQIFRFFAIASVSLLSLGLVAHASNGLPGRFPAIHKDWLTVSPTQFGEYVKGRYVNEIEDRPFGQSQRRLALVGDSSSQDFYNIIKEKDAFRSYDISGIYIPTDCQFFKGLEAPLQHWQENRAGICLRSQLNGERLRRVQQADVVVVAMRWRDWSIEGLESTIESLGLGPEQKLIIVGRKSFSDDPYQFMNVAARELPSVRADLSEDALAQNIRLKSSLPANVDYVDIYQIVCANGRCPVFTPQNQLISYDGFHLTPSGAAFLGNLLFAEYPLSKYIAH